MTKEQIEGFRLALQGLSVEELYRLKKDVDEQIEDLYWCDANFWHREKIDNYFYAVVYDDLTYHYDYIGRRSYEEYIGNDHAIRIECKTKDLFPEWKVLMQKGDHIEYKEKGLRYSLH